MKPTVIISLIKDTPRRFPGRRPQPWRYLVKNAGNNKFYEKSSENLTNRGDAIDAIMDVHGPDATVILREEGKDDRVIREPAPPTSRRIELSEDELNRVLDELGRRIISAPVTNLAVLARVVQIINEVIAPDYARGGVLPPGADLSIDLTGVHGQEI